MHTTGQTPFVENDHKIQLKVVEKATLTFFLLFLRSRLHFCLTNTSLFYIFCIDKTKTKNTFQCFNPALFLIHPKDTVNPTKCGCPFALKMAACQLLLEITTFLRETFPCLPRPRTEPLVVSHIKKICIHWVNNLLQYCNTT